VEEGEVSVLIGGKAGEGISSAGQVIAHLLGQLGYRVYMYFDYPSLIKGGHNFAIIRGAGEQIGAVRDRVDIILALDRETLRVHEWRLNGQGVVVCNADTVKNLPGIGIPVGAILASEQAPPVMGNSAILGAFVRASGIPWPLAEAVFAKSFRKGTAQNLRIARKGCDASEERLRIPALGKAPLPAFTGNEAMGIGLVEAGLGVYLSYPMSPTSNLMHFLAGKPGSRGSGSSSPRGRSRSSSRPSGAPMPGPVPRWGPRGAGSPSWWRPWASPAWLSFRP